MQHAPITQDQQRRVWTIHQSVNGLTYYYNRATRKSQYELPECFKFTEELLEHPDWREYKMADGRKFYYNQTNRKSSWVEPPEVKDRRLKNQENKRKERQANATQPNDDDARASEAEQLKKKFMALLRERRILISTKWESCRQICQDDERWQLFKISDKKKLFLQYVAQLKKANQDQKKAQQDRNRQIFVRMLRDLKNINSDSKLHRVALELQADSRWKALQEADRINTFQNFLDELANKERQQAKELKARLCEELRQYLIDEAIPFTMRWDDFCKKYPIKQKFKDLHSYDRLSTFAQYVMEAERKHDDENSRQKKLKQRQNRVYFRNLLRNKLMSGQLSYKSRWSSFVSSSRTNPDLLNMLDPHQHGTTAFEIFECCMAEIRESHRNIKTAIKLHFKKKAFKMTEETSQEQFETELADLQEYNTLRKLTKDYFHRYFQLKIKSKGESKHQTIKKTVKKERKTIFKIFDSLKDSLKTKYSIEEHMDKIERGMRDHSIIISQDSIFKYYVAYLERKASSRERESRSASNSSVSTRKNGKHGRSTVNSDLPKPMAIPSHLKNKEIDDVEEEGEIKDDLSQVK